MKRRILTMLYALVILTGTILITAINVSAATALPEGGMAFKSDTVYETNDIVKIDEDFTIESELWIDPASSDSYRGGIIVSDYMNYVDEYGAGVVPSRRLALEMYKNGRVRFWTDDAGVCEFDFDVRTVVTETEFAKIAVAVNVLKKDDTVDERYIDLNGNTVYGEATLYVNGIARQTMTITDETCAPGWFTVDSPLWVGGDKRIVDGVYNSEYFKGKIKNITIYSDIRTADELAASAAADVYSDELEETTDAIDKADAALLVAYD